eukprot:1156047-Pelagomonas_calceolata.AAC.3
MILTNQLHSLKDVIRPQNAKRVVLLGAAGWIAALYKLAAADEASLKLDGQTSSLRLSQHCQVRVPRPCKEQQHSHAQGSVLSLPKSNNTVMHRAVCLAFLRAPTQSCTGQCA